MKLVNFFKGKKERMPRISLCGKLEAVIGKYYLSGSGDIETLYYDPNAEMYDDIGLSEENIVAYLLENESVAIVREEFFVKLEEDTREYNMRLIPIKSFDAEILSQKSLETMMHMPQDFQWIDDDFMNDDTIAFDYDAFDLIDSGVAYLNPYHFSVNQLITALKNYSETSKWG